jgi:hypothetical protein
VFDGISPFIFQTRDSYPDSRSSVNRDSIGNEHRAAFVALLASVVGSRL